MELVILGLIVLFVYLFIRLLANLGAWMSGTRYRAYRQLAARYHGRYESRGISDTPTVSFAHNGSTVRVGLAPTIAGQPDQIPRTRVVARFPSGIPFRLELAPTTRPAPTQPPKGTRKIKIGDPEFDRGFVVQANDLEMARDFLTPHVRWIHRQLAAAGPPGGMLVSINPERMLVQVDRNLGSNADSLAYAVHEALVLHDGLLEGVGQAEESRDRHRRTSPTPGTKTMARRSARSVASPSPAARSSAVLSAIRPITATAGNMSAAVRSTDAPAKSVSPGNAIPNPLTRPPCPVASTTTSPWFSA